MALYAERVVWSPQSFIFFILAGEQSLHRVPSMYECIYWSAKRNDWMYIKILVTACVDKISFQQLALIGHTDFPDPSVVKAIDTPSELNTAYSLITCYCL